MTAPSVDSQLAVLGEKFTTMEKNIYRKVDDVVASMKNIQEKQNVRDTTCAAEREKNSEQARQLVDLWKKVEASDECRTCKQVERMTRLETQMQILVKVAWGLAGSTGALLLKLVFDLLRHSPQLTGG